MRRLLVGLAVPILLLTAACSSSSSPAARVVTLAAVHVSGPDTSAPQVTFKAPIAFSKTTSKIVRSSADTGPAVTMHSLVSVRYVGINASDESVFGSDWKSGSSPSTFYVNSAIKGFAAGLIGAKQGDRVLIGATSADAFGPTGNLAATVRPGDSVIFVVDVLKVFPEAALPATVPQLQYSADGNPEKFITSAGVTPTPTKLGVYTVVQGPGPVIKSGDEVSVDYFGQLYPGGKVFNAWTGEAYPFQLGANQVIDGWDLGLVGQHVGSRVVLVIPPALGYKDKAQGTTIPANSTLIFTVQIVSVS